jgi:RimJ/RimL family protein N-acetyltransferase
MIILRDVAEADLPVFLEHQLDAQANAMVGSVPRTKEEFLEHWARTSKDPRNRRLAVVCDGVLAGYVGSFDRLEKREVCYWLGREFWGKGIATRALGELLKREKARPLYARVAKGNIGSIRVLEKCGFARVGTDRYTNKAGEPIDELIYEAR